MSEEDVPWCQTGPRAPILVAVYWATYCCWICNIILGFYGSYKFLKMKQKMQLVFAILYIIISLLFIISPPGFSFGIQAGWECWYNTFRPWEGLTMLGVDGYAYGLAVLYLFFMLRLKKVFDSTGLSLNKWLLSLLYIALFIQLITPILFTFYFLAGWNEIDRGLALKYLAIFTFTNIVSSFLVLILFIKRILLLSSKPSTNNNNNKQIVIDIEKEIKKNNIEQEMLSLTIRYMICAIFALLSTNIVVIISIIRWTKPNNLEWRSIHLLCVLLDETINLICLYLQFPFAKTIYIKYCGGINRCVQLCFVKCLGLNVKNNKKISKPSNKTKATTNVEIEMSI